MVAPITGPFTTIRTIPTNAVGSFYSKQVGYKQKRPFTVPTAYTREMRGMLFYRQLETGTYGGSWLNVCNGRAPAAKIANLYDSTDPTMQALLNATREKFKGKIGDQAQLLTAIAESRRTMDMMATNIAKCYWFYRAARRGDFYGAADALGVVPRVRQKLKEDKTWKARWVGKQFADRSLEFAFGWAPLVSDIITAADVLSRPFPYHQVRARKSHAYRWTHKEAWGQTYGVDKTDVYHNVTLRTEVGAGVRIDNPNLALASNLGLTNFFGTVWEIVPWSFVVDYWFNVSQFLSQWTEFGGISFENPYHTIYSFDGVTLSHSFTYYGWVPPQLRGPANGDTVVEFGTRTERKLGIPAVTLNKKLPWNISKFRAWTSISLLLQILGKGH